MSHITSILQSKGGAGKSTLALSLAGLIAGQGSSVIIVDTDKQETAARWAATEVPGRGHIEYITELSDLAIIDLLQEIAQQFDHVIVDTAGFESRISGFVVGESDLVLIPCKATVADAQGAISTAKYVSAIAKSVRRQIPTRGVRVDFDRNTNATDALNALLAEHTDLEFMDAIQWHATSYKDALNTGEAVKGRARSLTEALLTELRRKKLMPLPIKRGKVQSAA